MLYNPLENANIIHHLCLPPRAASRSTILPARPARTPRPHSPPGCPGGRPQDVGASPPTPTPSGPIPATDVRVLCAGVTLVMSENTARNERVAGEAASASSSVGLSSLREDARASSIRELAAPWCGEGRLGRSPSHQGAFGRLSIILGVFFSAGKPATMPRPALVACAHQLPRSLAPLAACMRTDLSGMLELVHMLTLPCVLADAGRPRCSGVR